VYLTLVPHYSTLFSALTLFVADTHTQTMWNVERSEQQEEVRAYSFEYDVTRFSLLSPVY
jgi:hypothetical protein